MTEVEAIFDYDNGLVTFPGELPTPFERVSYSSKSSLHQCPAKFYWSNIRGLSPKIGSTSIRFGSVFHSLLDHFYSYIKQNSWQKREQAIVQALAGVGHFWNEATGNQIFHEDHRTKENVVQLFLTYADRWMEDSMNLEILDTELYYRLEIKVTEDEYNLFPHLKNIRVFVTGIRDLRIRECGNLWVYEHKTTGSWIQSIKKTLFRSPQIINYDWVERMMHPDDPLEGVMVNIAHFSQYKKKDGSYGAVKMEFDRSPQIFTKKDILAHRLRTLEQVNEIIMRKKLQLWTQETDSCFLFNSSCEYLELCEQHRALESTHVDNFIARKERNQIPVTMKEG